MLFNSDSESNYTTRCGQTNGAEFHDHPQFFAYNKRRVISHHILVAALAHCLDFFLKHTL